MLELQESPSRGALLKKGQFDKGRPDPDKSTDVSPTESEKGKPGLSGFMKQLQEKQARDAEKNIIRPGEQVPLKGSNTTVSSTTEFKDLKPSLKV